jgi:hypothetical protein
MGPHSDLFKPTPAFDSTVSHVISPSETDGGVVLDNLPVGTRLEVKTSSRTYEIENRGHGDVLISGHPDICPEPVLVSMHGSTWGGALLKLHYICSGMGLEFRHPTRGIVRTSKVTEVRQLNPA